MSWYTVVEFIEGHWSKVSDAKINALRVWVERRHIRDDDVLAALDSLIDDGLEFAPKTAQLAKKLKEMGGLPPVPLGVGDRGVVGRMKQDIIEGIQDTVSILPQWTYGGRLRSEQEAAQLSAQTDRDLELGSADYWHDRLLAFGELVEADMR